MYAKVWNYLRGSVLFQCESPAPERVLNLCAAHGIPFASTPFYPHISLLRHPTSLRFTDIKVPATPITVEGISVMKSERIEGELVYSEL